MSELQIRELIQEIDLCLELLGYEREALERMREKPKEDFICGYRKCGYPKRDIFVDKEDGYEEHLRYGVFPGNLEDG